MESKVLSVSELNRQAKRALEASLPLMWVCGEISNLTRASSGHVYFTLKDSAAQVRCVMFRSRAQLLPWRLENGQQVEVQALVTLYEARGDYQLNVEGMRRAGLGRLYEAFARLRDKLAAEGLFAAEAKRALPAYPRRIALVTSPQAAALRDILATFKRRAPQLELVLFPCMVQGEAAAGEIVAALAAAGRSDCEVIVLARGGGSIEDLWNFNEEAVARAIAASPLPVVAGVGHETDTTIADFVADMRAATPTAAAELVSASWFAASSRVQGLAAVLRSAARQYVESRMQRLDLLAHRLISPQEMLKRSRYQLAHLQTRLTSANARSMQARQHRCAQVGQGLQLLNPAATLQRGYSIVRNANGDIVASAGQITVGEGLSLRFGEGGAAVHVERIQGEE